MTKTEVADQDSTPRVVQPVLIRCDKITPSPVQARVVFDEEKLLGLAGSISKHGLMHPILVRVLKTDKKGVSEYELVSGERRLRAVRLIPWDTIPAQVRDITEQQANEITCEENLQREDLSPIEEARSVAVLLKREGATVESVADSVGKSPSWVARRTKLVDLSDAWQRAVDGSDKTFESGPLWPTAHLERIARLRHVDQDELLDNYRNDNSVPTLGELTTRIERDVLRLLSSAPWPMKDASLGEKRSCEECQERTGCQLLLFGDLDVRGRKPGLGYCLDSTCWDTKAEEFRDRRYAELVKQNAKLKVVSTFWNGANNLPKDMKDRLVERYSLTTCKKSEEGAVPVLYADGPSMGKVEWFKPQNHNHSSSGSSGAGEATGAPKTLKERRAGLQKRRNKEFDAYALRYLEDVDVDSLKAVLKLPQIVAAVTVWGGSGLKYGEQYGMTGWKSYDKQVLGDGPEITAMVEGLLPVWAKQISEDMRSECTGEFAARALEYLGVPVDTVRDGIDLQVPEPKSWASLKADGTPKGAGAKEKAVRKTGTDDAQFGDED